MEAKCVHCKAVIIRPPSMLANRKFGPFCSRQCLGKYRSQFLVGALSANYKTGSRKDRLYIEVEALWHPNSNKRGYVSLHRLIVEASLKRFLKDDEVVHHKDHDPRNNHWDNLEVFTYAEHAREHMKTRKRLSNGRIK